MAIKTYSLAKDGGTKLSANFAVREFACRDGSDAVLIDDGLVAILQKIRDRFGAAVTINSGYRTAAYNKAIGGAANSFHTKGRAADITVAGVATGTVAQYAESMGAPGIGWYDYTGGFVHVDTRAVRYYWTLKAPGGAETPVDSFGALETGAASGSAGGAENGEEEAEMVRYEKLGDIPNDYGFRDVVETLMDARIIMGDGSDASGNDDVIDLSHDQVRSLVFEYRGGAFDRKLKAMGLTPAVED